MSPSAGYEPGQGRPRADLGKGDAAPWPQPRFRTGWETSSRNASTRVYGKRPCLLTPKWEGLQVRTICPELVLGLTLMRLSKCHRLLVPGLLFSAMLACSAFPVARTQGLAVPGGVRIRVVNSTVADVVIWILRSDTPIRLGRVDSGDTRVFAANQAMIGSGGSLSLRAEATITGRRVVSSPRFTLDPGQSIEWTLRDGVAASSTLIIR